MNFIHYNRKFKERARELRKNRNVSEVILWKYIRKKQLGYQFLRQRPIQNYIVDFYCKELILAIEIDGPIHEKQPEDDILRQHILESFGITFIRFNDNDVRNNIDYVLRDIRKDILRLAQASPPPSKEESGNTAFDE